MRPSNGLIVAVIAAALVVLFTLVALTGECGGMGGCIATAKVNGQTYSLSIARSIDIVPADLTRYATVGRRSPGQETLDDDAYQLGDVDPTKVLVMKLAPGQSDQAGDLGNYLLLVSDASAWPLTLSVLPTRATPFGPRSAP